MPARLAVPQALPLVPKFSAALLFVGVAGAVAQKERCPRLALA